MKLFSMLKLVALLWLLLPVLHAAENEEATDHRAWQHGMELLKLDGKNLLIWSSWGNPPIANPEPDWEHDIYYTWVDSCANHISSPTLLVGGYEAQEPPSAAVNNRGKILLTWEDGTQGINQYAAFWDGSAAQVNKQFLIATGGHSGHVAASRDRFLVTYSEGWMEAEDSFRGLGTGKHLRARIIEDDGRTGPEIRISSGTPERREDWPVVAGSDKGWMITWQRYPQRTLHTVVIDHAGAILQRTLIVEDLRVGYHYDVQYLPALKAYLVLATTTTGGVAVLMDVHGQIIARNDDLPPLASESRFVWSANPAGVVGVYPAMPSGIAVIQVSTEKIALQKTLASDFQWDYIGTAGTFVSDSKVLFATLSTEGLKMFTFNLTEPTFVVHLNAQRCTTADSSGG